MTSAGVGPLGFSQKMNSALPSAYKRHGDADVIFQLNFQVAHTAKTSTCLNDHGISALVNLPYINSIENLWSICRRAEVLLF